MFDLGAPVKAVTDPSPSRSEKRAIPTVTKLNYVIFSDRRACMLCLALRANFSGVTSGTRGFVMQFLYICDCEKQVLSQ